MSDEYVTDAVHLFNIAWGDTRKENKKENHCASWCRNMHSDNLRAWERRIFGVVHAARDHLRGGGQREVIVVNGT